METQLQILFGKNVRFFRKQLKLTQFQLAEIINCSPSFIGFIENGKSSVSFGTIESLSHALQVPVSRLFMKNESDGTLYISAPSPRYSPEAVKILSELTHFVEKHRKKIDKTGKSSKKN